jgi:hypothetical protein
MASKHEETENKEKEVTRKRRTEKREMVGTKQKEIEQEARENTNGSSIWCDCEGPVSEKVPWMKMFVWL